MNSSFDEELRKAVGRVEPPEGFAHRVMTKIPNRRSKSGYWFAAVAASLALLFSAGGIEQNRREHRMQAQRAQQQMVFALSLTAEKLEHVNARLQRSAPDLTIEHDERGRL